MSAYSLGIATGCAAAAGLWLLGGLATFLALLAAAGGKEQTQ